MSNEIKTSPKLFQVFRYRGAKQNGELRTKRGENARKRESLWS